MARTGTDENKQANSQADAVQQDQIKRANTATDSYNQKLNTISTGGKIATNPWQDPEYLRNLTQNAAFASSGSNAANKEQMDLEALRTGENTEGRKATAASLSRAKNRDMAQGLNQQSVLDNDKYQQYQMSLLNGTLAPAGTSTALYGDATQGRDAALNNLTSIGNAQQAMWGSIIGGAAAGAGSAFQGKG